MTRLALVAALLLQGGMQPMTPSLMTSQHFEVTAAYEAPAKKGAPAQPRVRVQDRRTPTSTSTKSRPRASSSPPVARWSLPRRRRVPGVIPDPANVKYLDLSKPVRFAVTPAPNAAKGMSRVKTTLSYFYCSKRENWCRKGTADFDLAVVLP